MKTLVLFLFCLLTTQAASTRKSKRGFSRYRVREAPGGGYQYDAPATGGMTMAALMNAHHETMSSFGEGSGGVSAGVAQGGGGDSVGGSGGYNYEPPAAPASGGTSGGSSGSAGTYHYDAPATPTAGNSAASAAPPGFEDIQSFTNGATAVLDASAGSATGHNFGGGASSGGFSIGGSNGGGGGYNFNSIFNSGGGGGGIGGSSGSSDQYTAVQGEVIDEHPPSVFNYKPQFGGKDINNLPHILPPGGKSIQELQDEADAKLRAIIAKAKMNQMEVLERISKLKTNYGYGTLGFDGFKDTRFKQMGNIDLGSHKGIDLGTSIDYNALKGSDGKLKLPVQNVYHTKTLGIHIPEPYPVKHEVAVPAPFPVPQPIPVSHHKPTSYSPLSHDDIAHLSADDGRGGFAGFGHFGGGGGGGGANGGFEEPSFGSDFSFGTKNASPTFKSVSSGSFSIEPSQSISESSSTGGLPYGAGTPNAAPNPAEQGDTGEGGVEYVNDSGQVEQNTFGLPAGVPSGGLNSFSSGQRPSQEYGGPQPQTQAISSEAGTVHIPSMNFGGSRYQEGSSQSEYGPPR